MYESVGILRSGPKAKGLECGKWWLIADCDPGIGRYYRHLYNLYNRGGYKRVMRPAWECHISIVCGETPTDAFLDKWGRWDGQELPFRYDVTMQENDEYVWLNVEAPLASQIRREFGMSDQPFYPFHLTIGKVV